MTWLQVNEMKGDNVLFAENKCRIGLNLHTHTHK